MAPPRRDPSPEEAKALVELNDLEMQRRFNIHPATVSRWRRELGVVSRGRYGLPSYSKPTQGVYGFATGANELPSVRWDTASQAHTTPDGWELWAFTGDEQQPYGDPRAIELATKILDGVRPKLSGYANLGDLLDNYHLSVYDKSPLRSLRREEIADLIDRLNARVAETPDSIPDVNIQQELMDMALQREFDRARDTLADYRAAIGPDIDMHYVLGNHEHRLLTFLQRQAPALLGLRLPGEREPVLTVKRLLGLDDLGVTAHYDRMKESTWALMPSFYVGHFDMARKGSAMTAKGLVEDRGVNVVQAHCHRQGLYYKTLMDGRELVGVENAMLCRKDGLGYMASPNWQHGMTLVRIHRERGEVHPVPIHFVNYRAWCEGVLYTA